jgi:hypothetical protein
MSPISNVPNVTASAGAKAYRTNPPGSRYLHQSQTDAPNDEEIRSKKLLNYVTNGGAALLNLTHFINSNWGFSEFLKDKLEFASSLMTRAAVVSQGVLLTNETWNAKNLIPFIGTVSEIPIALFSSDENIWFNRGWSQGLGQFYSMIAKRHVKENGESVYDAHGKPVCMNPDFSKHGLSGFLESTKVTIRESGKIISELIKEPTNFLHNYSHSIFIASAGQITGTILGILGLKTPGAIIRDIFGTAVDFALTRDDENKKRFADSGTQKHKLFNLDFSSIFVWSGLTWVLAAIVDAYKRIPFLAGGLDALTNLSLTSDRFASMLYTEGNLNIKQEKAKKEKERLGLGVAG